MPSQGWTQLLNGGAPWQTTAGVNLTGATTATISPQGAGNKDFVIATSYLYPGSVFRITAQGFLTTTATSTTATIFLAAGVTPTTLCTANGITTGTTVITGIQWTVKVYCRITAIGSTGNTISSQGFLDVRNSGAAVPANPIALTGAAGISLAMPNASGETAAAIDTTSAMAIMLRGTLAAANATVGCTQFLVESLN